MIFLVRSRYNKYESNMINKRINGPPILLSKQTKKKSLPLCRCQAARKRVSVLVFIKEDCCIFYDSHLYRIHSPRIGK